MKYLLSLHIIIFISSTSFSQEFTMSEIIKMASLDKRSFDKFVVGQKGFTYDEYTSKNQKDFLTYEHYPLKNGSRIFFYLKENFNNCSGINYYFYMGGMDNCRNLINEIISLGFKPDFLTMPKNLEEFERFIHFRKGNSRFTFWYSKHGHSIRLRYPKRLDTDYDFTIAYTNTAD